MQTSNRRIPLVSPPTTNPLREQPVLERLKRSLMVELRAWQLALRTPALYILLALLLAGMLLAVQLPLSYTIDVGVEEGYGGDLPLLSGFNTAEHDEHGTYRWTADRAQITVPGLGQRAVTLQLAFFPISPEALEFGPTEINIWLNNERELLAVLPVRQAGGRYLVHIPAHLMQNGTLDLTIRTHTFIPQNPDDPRSLGTPLDAVQITAAASLLPVLPDWGAVSAWLLTALLCWATILRALEASPQRQRWAIGFVGLGVVLVLIAAVLDPGRWAFGAQPALIAVAISYVLVLVLRPVCTALAHHFSIPLTSRTLGWLLLIVVLAFGLRYGGRLYPNSMHGDIGFHTNRFNEISQGHIFLLSRNRGVDFPYPPGPYVMLAPLAILRPDPAYLLQLGAALVEGLSALLIYTIVARTGKRCRDWQQHAEQPVAPPGYSRELRVALLAAAIYVFTAAGFMTTWWSFDTHIYTQFSTLLLITVVNDLGLRSLQPPGTEANAPRWQALRWWAIIFVLCGLVFLGHFGFFINTVLLGGLMLALLALTAWRGGQWAQRLFTPVALAGISAGLVAAALFYTFFLPLLTAQAQAVSQGGLTGLADRAPVERAYLWQVLWEAGFVQHFGFFPVLLALPGIGLLIRWGRPAWVTAALIVGSFLVSTMFAILPFITLSTQSTRWLMFSAWAIAIGAAVALPWFWQRRWSGRLVVVTMAGFVLWNTIVLWVGPMLWRIRPPEPF